MIKARILVVEDDGVLATIERWRLMELGYEICGSVKNGEDALNSIENLHPDLIIMDIGLKGGIDGIETATRIKKNFNIPFVFISSHTDEATISKLKAFHARSFVKKPFDDDDLRIAIELELNK
jgi:DNA-binding NarL/FixJ family response regulator